MLYQLVESAEIDYTNKSFVVVWPGDAETSPATVASLHLSEAACEGGGGALPLAALTIGLDNSRGAVTTLDSDDHPSYFYSKADIATRKAEAVAAAQALYTAKGAAALTAACCGGEGAPASCGADPTNTGNSTSPEGNSTSPAEVENCTQCTSVGDCCHFCTDDQCGGADGCSWDSSVLAPSNPSGNDGKCLPGEASASPVVAEDSGWMAPSPEESDESSQEESDESPPTHPSG